MLLGLGILIGSELFPKIEKEEVIKERVKRVTRIVERPDGTKETIINEETKKDTVKKESPVGNEWYVSMGQSMIGGETIYTLHTSRKIIGDLYLGGYGRTDKEYGLIIGYNF